MNLTNNTVLTNQQTRTISDSGGRKLYTCLMCVPDAQFHTIFNT